MNEEESAILRRLAELINKPKQPVSPRSELLRSLLAQTKPPTNPNPFNNLFAQPKPTARVPFSLPKAVQPPQATSNPFRAKIKLVKPKVFVSFDYENDAKYKYILEAWNANSKFQFTFQDHTPDEIQSNDVGRIKAVLTTKVQQATHTLILVGQHANEPHRDAAEIGCLNWIHFEVQQSILYKKKLVAVFLEPGNLTPTNAVGQPGIEVNSFNQAEIIAALSQ